MRRNINKRRNSSVLVYFLFSIIGLVFLHGTAWAHKVTIFAWVEGNTVFTQSKFSGSRKARNSTVVVYDKQGNQLVEGQTDEKGEFSFKVPKITDLKVVLKASMGHLAEWTIPVEELAGVEPPSAAPAAVQTDGTNFSLDSVGSREQAETTESATIGLNKQEVKEIVEACLDKKLAPIKSMLVESVDRGPGLTEIIGGIGYILGLVGVALYFTGRRKNT